MHRRVPLTVVLALVAPPGSIAPCLAADPVSSYPVRPTRLLVPRGVGASNDTLSRALAGKLGDTLGQQIERQGGDPVVSTPEDFAKFNREEWDPFGQAIKAARLKVE